MVAGQRVSGKLIMVSVRTQILPIIQVSTMVLVRWLEPLLVFRIPSDRLRSYASMVVKSNTVTSKRPISVSFNSGITGSAIKHNVINGSTLSLTPNSLCAIL